MLLTMAALMVAIVWLVSQVSEATLPAIDLPTSEAAGLGASERTSVQVTLRPADSGAVAVFVDETELPGGLDALRSALDEGPDVTLRADAGTRWEDALHAMGIAAELGLEVSVAVAR